MLFRSVGDGRTPSSATAPTGAVKAEAKIVAESGPKLVATKTGPHIISAGKTGRWTITVRNVGKDDARGTVAWDDLPAGFSIVRAKGLGPVTPVRIQKGSVRFDIGVLKAGGVRRLVVTIHVAENHSGGVTYNRARVVARNAKLSRGKATVIVKPRVLATRIRPALTG